MDSSEVEAVACSLEEAAVVLQGEEEVAHQVEEAEVLQEAGAVACS